MDERFQMEEFDGKLWSNIYPVTRPEYLEGNLSHENLILNGDFHDALDNWIDVSNSLEPKLSITSKDSNELSKEYLNVEKDISIINKSIITVNENDMLTISFKLNSKDNDDSFDFDKNIKVSLFSVEGNSKLTDSVIEFSNTSIKKYNSFGDSLIIRTIKIKSNIDKCNLNLDFTGNTNLLITDIKIQKSGIFTGWSLSPFESSGGGSSVGGLYFSSKNSKGNTETNDECITKKCFKGSSSSKEVIMETRKTKCLHLPYNIGIRIKISSPDSGDKNTILNVKVNGETQASLSRADFYNQKWVYKNIVWESNAESFVITLETDTSGGTTDIFVENIFVSTLGKAFIE